ncbi:MAG TPA: hypothetical protein O0X39_07650 [Methanocorpusculum sp.]|nr:hypothetical protein [Methanocorpusculum sp.]
MYIELTKDDIQAALIDSDLLVDYEKMTGVKEADLPFLIHLHAENLACVLSELAKEYQAIADDYLKECLNTPNDRFRIETEIRRKVNIAKLIELRPDLYESYRILEPSFVARRFTPWDLIEMFKKAGVTEEEIRSKPGNVKVRIDDIKDRVSEDEAEQILLPDKYHYTVCEVEE